ncbi:hypothetical protein ECB90_04985 [Helicobacter pylori]|nr:hypothetical protein ECB90_04985 [Helicobacter pylori]
MFFLLFGLNWISIRDFIHWNAFALERICIRMYLKYYSIKRFFFVIWRKFCDFFVFCVTFERFLIGF